MEHTTQFIFDVDETVLAYHGPLIYQATVLKRLSKAAPEEVRLYLLHYNGWHSHWDEWVAESRILKNEERNLATQKARIREVHRVYKERLSKSADEVAKRQKTDKAVRDVHEALRLPHSLKLKLLEDWEKITRERCHKRFDTVDEWH